MKNTNYSVKKYHSYGILMLALLLCSSANAKVEHWVGAAASVGEWSMLPSGSNYSASLGVSGGLGFQYELQAGKTQSPLRFLLDVGAGVNGGMTAYRQSSDITEVLPGQKDVSGDYFDYVYEITNRRDRYNNVALHMPLMVGLQYRRFYMLAGIKLYANIWTQARSTASLSTYGHYEQYIGMSPDGSGNLRNMPEYQFFSDKSLETKVKTSLNLDADASLEIGARLGMLTSAIGYDVPKRNIEYRIVVFADYGLRDLHNKGTVEKALDMPSLYDTDKGSKDYVYKTETMVDKNHLVMNDIMSTAGFADEVKNLMVGVKFTVLFQLPEEGKCVICRDSYNTSIRSYGGSRAGMKYEE